LRAKLTIRWLGTVLLLNWSILPIDLLCFYMVLLSADKFNQTCSHIVTEQRRLMAGQKTLATRCDTGKIWNKT